LQTKPPQSKTLQSLSQSAPQIFQIVLLLRPPAAQRSKPEEEVCDLKQCEHDKTKTCPCFAPHVLYPLSFQKSSNPLAPVRRQWKTSIRTNFEMVADRYASYCARVEGRPVIHQPSQCSSIAKKKKKRKRRRKQTKNIHKNKKRKNDKKKKNAQLCYDRELQFFFMNYSVNHKRLCPSANPESKSNVLRCSSPSTAFVCANRTLVIHM
jgi:hypothetical protein